MTPLREFFRTERQTNITLQAIAMLAMTGYILWMQPMNSRPWIVVMTLPFTHWPRTKSNRSDNARNPQKKSEP